MASVITGFMGAFFLGQGIKADAPSPWLIGLVMGAVAVVVAMLWLAIRHLEIQLEAFRTKVDDSLESFQDQTLRRLERKS